MIKLTASWKQLQQPPTSCAAEMEATWRWFHKGSGGIPVDLPIVCTPTCLNSVKEKKPWMMMSPNECLNYLCSVRIPIAADRNGILFFGVYQWKWKVPCWIESSVYLRTGTRCQRCGLPLLWTHVASHRATLYGSLFLLSFCTLNKGCFSWGGPPRYHMFFLWSDSDSISEYMKLNFMPQYKSYVDPSLLLCWNSPHFWTS